MSRVCLDPDGRFPAVGSADFQARELLTTNMKTSLGLPRGRRRHGRAPGEPRRWSVQTHNGPAQRRGPTGGP